MKEKRRERILSWFIYGCNENKKPAVIAFPAEVKNIFH